MDRQIQQNMKTTMHKRTIERCIKDDPRILKDGSYYYINDKARFERRYQRPDLFGEDMHYELFRERDFKLPSLDRQFDDFIRKWGALIMFIFIEAVRPFEDKSLTLRDRSDLVGYWAKNALPINEMWNHFRILGSDHINHYTSEMEESRIKDLLNAFEKTYPDLYKILMQARNEQAVSPGMIGPDGKIELIHAKTYHSGWSDWLAYLKDTNPKVYKHEMERIEEEQAKRRWRLRE